MIIFIQDLHSVAQTLRIVVGVPLGHDRRFVAHQLLHLVKIDSRLNKSRREGVAQIMKPALAHLCLLHIQIERPPKIARIQPLALAVEEDPV